MFNNIEIVYTDDMHDLIAFQRDLLYVIAAMNEPSGLAIKQELDEYDETDITPPRLYPNLDALVKQGYVRKGHPDGRTNSYALTRRGRRKLDARSRWEARLAGLTEGELPSRDAAVSSEVSDLV